MKVLKKVSILTCAVMVAAAIALTACKKNEPEETMADIGKKAAHEFCDCWGEYEDDFMAQLENCAAGLYMEYGEYIEDEEFYAAFGEEIYVCHEDVDWDAIFCMLGMGECEE